MKESSAEDYYNQEMLFKPTIPDSGVKGSIILKYYCENITNRKKMT